MEIIGAICYWFIQGMFWLVGLTVFIVFFFGTGVSHKPFPFPAKRPKEAPSPNPGKDKLPKKTSKSSYQTISSYGEEHQITNPVEFDT